ncbi:MAG: hypothetical protein J7K51_00870 [Thermotogae bacterium]|nr:hypothetical protein [Thermotogota bacterium]
MLDKANKCPFLTAGSGYFKSVLTKGTHSIGLPRIVQREGDGKPAGRRMALEKDKGIDEVVENGEDEGRNTGTVQETGDKDA